MNEVEKSKIDVLRSRIALLQSDIADEPLRFVRLQAWRQAELAQAQFLAVTLQLMEDAE